MVGKTIVDQARDYFDRAESVIETDTIFVEENPGVTIEDYAFDLVDGDIKHAIHTEQKEWKKELKDVKRYMQKMVKNKEV